MPKRLQKEIDKLKQDLMDMAELSKKALGNAIQCIEQRDNQLAKSLIYEDDIIDRKENDVEEECLKLLALYQPVAVDLRLIISVLKINNDLERIGDLAANIAQKAIWLQKREKIESPFNLSLMESKVKSMLEKSIEAFVKLDIGLAQRVRHADEEVDAIHRHAYEAVKDVMRKHPEQIDSLIDLLSVSRSLERIADSATNIAEDVIYLVEGEIARHKPIILDPQSRSHPAITNPSSPPPSTPKPKAV